MTGNMVFLLFLAFYFIIGVIVYCICKINS